jgi:hypothetical protein
VCIDSACGSNPRRVFVTSRTFVGGDLGGLASADSICRDLATTAGLSRSYAAWLSDSKASPESRFLKDGGPYILVDGTIVANNWRDLTSGRLRHAIDLTELGTPPPAIEGCTGAVWTGTTEAGGLMDPAATCGDWMDRAAGASVQGSTQSTDHWSYFCAGFGDGECVAMLATLFCFEQ